MPSFNDALNESMSSSPLRDSLDSNIDPSLQYTTPTRNRSNHSQTPQHTSSTVRPRQVATPSTLQKNSMSASTGAAEPQTAIDQSSSSDEDEEETQELSEAQMYIRRLAQHNTLNQGNTQELMNFSMVITQKARDNHIYAKLLAIEQAIGAGASWTPSQDAMRNIQRYCVSVLLSPELPSYRSSITTRIVMDVLKSVPSQLPSGWPADPHKTALVMKCVNGYLTQIRADFKKKLLASIAPVEDARDAIDIAQLADSLANSTVTVTAPLWARISFLRGILTSDTGANFWKSVDTELKKLREKALEKADGDEEKAKKKMHKQLKKILELDYQVYGNPAAHRIIPSQGGLQEWQRAADNAASKAIGITIATKRKSSFP